MQGHYLVPSKQQVKLSRCPTPYTGAAGTSSHSGHRAPHPALMGAIDSPHREALLSSSGVHTFILLSCCAHEDWMEMALPTPIFCLICFFLVRLLASLPFSAHRGVWTQVVSTDREEQVK